VKEAYFISQHYATFIKLSNLLSVARKNSFIIANVTLVGVYIDVYSKCTEAVGYI